MRDCSLLSCSHSCPSGCEVWGVRCGSDRWGLTGPELSQVTSEMTNVGGRGGTPPLLQSPGWAWCDRYNLETKAGDLTLNMRERGRREDKAGNNKTLSPNTGLTPAKATVSATLWNDLSLCQNIMFFFNRWMSYLQKSTDGTNLVKLFMTWLVSPGFVKCFWAAF